MFQCGFIEVVGWGVSQHVDVTDKQHVGFIFLLLLLLLFFLTFSHHKAQK